MSVARAQLRVWVAESFTSEMEQLRRQGFHDPMKRESSRDEFDVHSSHFVATLDGNLAGMVRMTPEPPSVLQTWFRGRAPLPTGAGVVDATRAVVSETSRGMGLYKVLMLEALSWADSKGFDNVVGAIEPEFPAREFLRATGCADVGDPLQSWHPPVTETLGQCILWRRGEFMNKVITLRDGLRAKLADKGIEVVGPNCFNL